MISGATPSLAKYNGTPVRTVCPGSVRGRSLVLAFALLLAFPAVADEKPDCTKPALVAALRELVADATPVGTGIGTVGAAVCTACSCGLLGFDENGQPIEYTAEESAAACAEERAASARAEAERSRERLNRRLAAEALLAACGEVK